MSASDPKDNILRDPARRPPKRQPARNAIAKSCQARLERTRRREHPACLVRDSGGAAGLDLRFRVRRDGSVAANCRCSSRHQGYPGILHGGVVAILLDSAMTNCLFAHGIVAVTAAMNIRFRHPVVPGRKLTVRARITSSLGPLHLLAAQIVQDGKVKANATAKFMARQAG